MSAPAPALARTILVVEDEASIADAVATRLRSEGFAVAIAADGPSGIEQCRSLRPDLVVLDLMLPGLDGLEVCREIQRDRPVPVLMLTARDSETDLVVGLGGRRRRLPHQAVQLPGAGGPGPRAAPAGRAPAGHRRAEACVLGSLTIDLESRRVHLDDELVHLTPTEFDLLAHLAARPTRVFTREQLLAEVWGYHDGAGTRTVDSHVRALRRKLGNDIVRTVHGVGYAAGEPHPEVSAS